MGALTEYLVSKDTYYLGYEIDMRMDDYLSKFKSDKIKIIYGDFLNQDIKEDIKKFNYDNLYVVANIPYYITSPIIMKLINSGMEFQNIVLLVQKEFGNRLVAKENSKDYNAFTIMVNYFYDVNIEFNVGRNNFDPVPNVDSVVVNMKLKSYEKIPNLEDYFAFVRMAFRNKRKTLKNNLGNDYFLKIKNVLLDMGIKENVRAEQISKEDFLTLWKKIN